MPLRKAKATNRVTKRTATSSRRQKTTTCLTQSSDGNDTNSADTSSSSPTPVYFWRETEPSTGYLSQWYPCAFTDDTNPGIIFKTAEHYMMYHKALLFDDTATASAILSASHPRKAKALGRRVSNFSEAVWDAHRDKIVYRGNLLKFTRPADEADGWWFQRRREEQDQEQEQEQDGRGLLSLRELLLGTGERELVEASPFDRIWGIGFRAEQAETVGRERWGMNLLGKALMEVRAALRREGGGLESEKGSGEKGEEGEEGRKD
ncbi:hypothetical protein VTK56DRAFT_5376 [Thermocarpiscus australiensis]